ncbi:MAG TPA: hypothetical protein VNI20_07850, partial [Fimbriimonadaceae bacterium]|nr:hypothetical protein [Fimbriimonadaceae bacterium]
PWGHGLSLAPGYWAAKWVSYSQNPSDDLGVFVFRRLLTVQGQIGERSIRISADQRYRLFVNGHQVGFGPQRGDAAHWFYENYDIGPHLKEGANWIVVQVWHFGRYAPMAQHTARQGLVVQGEGLSTPDSWEVAKLDGWTFEMMNSQVGPFYIDVGPGEKIDARAVGAGWADGGDAGLNWREPNVVCDAVMRGGGGGGTPWMLVPRTLPQMLYEPRAKAPFVCDLDDGGRKRFESGLIRPTEPLLLDYRELLTAFPRFTLDGPAGTKVTATYSEAFFQPDGQKGHRDEFSGKEMWGYQDEIVLDGSKRTFEPCWWRTYRYLRLESDAEVQVERVEALETGYPVRPEASFEADGTGDVWDTCVRTVKRCAGETYFDCPYYEQLQYVGDTRIQALIGYYLSRDRALQRNAVEQFSWSITPEGLTQSRYPSRQIQMIPPFSLWWVIMLYDQWLYDRMPVSGVHLDQARRVLDAWDRLIEGSQERAYWTFADWVPGWRWGEPPGKARSSIHIFTKWLAELAVARIQGAESRIDLIRKQLAGTERAENGLIFHPQDPVKFASEHGAALFRLCQRLAGVHPDPWPHRALTGGAKCTYYFSYYKHIAQCPADYMSELGPWREMLDAGLTT